MHQKTLSILKGFGIICVVAGHASPQGFLMYFMYLFHVAIFFFVSGYFFKDEYLTSPFEYFKKKIKRLYFPFVAFGIVMVLLHNLFVDLDLFSWNFRKNFAVDYYDSGVIFKKIIGVLTFQWKEPILAPLWFLYGLFSGLIVFFIVSLISQKISVKRFEVTRFLLMTLVFVFALTISELFNHRFSLIIRPMVIAGLIYSGKLFALAKDRIKLNGYISFIFMLILAFLASQRYYINIGALLLGNPLIFLPISFAGIYMIITLSEFISKKNGYLSETLDYIGKNTLTILALHYFAFKLVALLQINIYEYPQNFLSYYPVMPQNNEIWWVIYLIAGIIMPLLVARLIDSFKTD